MRQRPGRRAPLGKQQTKHVVGLATERTESHSLGQVREKRRPTQGLRWLVVAASSRSCRQQSHCCQDQGWRREVAFLSQGLGALELSSLLDKSLHNPTAQHDDASGGIPGGRSMGGKPTLRLLFIREKNTTSEGRCSPSLTCGREMG